MWSSHWSSHHPSIFHHLSIVEGATGPKEEPRHPSSPWQSPAPPGDSKRFRGHLCPGSHSFCFNPYLMIVGLEHRQTNKLSALPFDWTLSLPRQTEATSSLLRAQSVNPSLALSLMKKDSIYLFHINVNNQNSTHLVFSVQVLLSLLNLCFYFLWKKKRAQRSDWP